MILCLNGSSRLSRGSAGERETRGLGDAKSENQYSSAILRLDTWCRDTLTALVSGNERAREELVPLLQIKKLMEGRIRKEGVAINPRPQKDLKVMQEELRLSQYAFPF